MPDAKNKIIEGLTFSITQPYETGHVCTEAEARALNQVRSENIGNNLRKTVKEHIEKGTQEALVDIVAKYDASYVFAVPGVGSTRILDPVERELHALAKENLKAKLADKGLKYNAVHPNFAGLPEEEGKAKTKELYDAAIEKLMGEDALIKLAKQRVSQKQKTADSVAADLGI